MIRVELSALEQRIVKGWALAVQLHHESHDNAVGSRQVDFTTGQMHKKVNGFGAELAFARLMNLYPDFLLDSRGRGADFVLPSGASVDVKWTESRRLIARAEHKRKPCDLYALFTGQFPTFAYRGYTTWAVLFDDANLGLLNGQTDRSGMPMCYSLDWAFLNSDLPPTLPSYSPLDRLQAKV